MYYFNCFEGATGTKLQTFKGNRFNNEEYTGAEVLGSIS